MNELPDKDKYTAGRYALSRLPEQGRQPGGLLVDSGGRAQMPQTVHRVVFISTWLLAQLINQRELITHDKCFLNNLKYYL